MSEVSICLHQVSKTLGERTVLRELNLTVRVGERIVLHGPSGCGKTTILRLIAGFLAPDAGSVSVNDLPASCDGRVLIPPEKRGLGFVFQDLALWPHMTVGENVEFPLKALKAPSPERKTRVAEALARVGLDGLSGSYPTRLSGGQQQRVALARAIVSRPKILLMDEPLANLDEELQSAMTDEILRLHRENGFALVYVTHSKEERRRLATRSIRIRGGAVDEETPS